MTSLDEASAKLEALGAKHMPVQYLVCEKCGAGTNKPDGRYVTLRDDPGVYYLRGDDNMASRIAVGKGAEERVQLLAMFAELDAQKFADALGWVVESDSPMPGPDGKTMIGSMAFLAPKREKDMPDEKEETNGAQGDQAPQAAEQEAQAEKPADEAGGTADETPPPTTTEEETGD
jgi:hypothetical protein